MKRYLLLFSLITISALFSTAQNTPTQNIQRYEYWLDDNYTDVVRHEFAGNSLNLDVDLSNKQPGLHFISIRTQDVDTIWGGISRYMFYLDNSYEACTKVEYWIDDNYTDAKTVSVDPTSVLLSMDISNLKSGDHVLYVRGLTSAGEYGVLNRFEFNTAGGPSPYAVLSSDNPTQGGDAVLTFYYDTLRYDRNGMVIGPFANAESRGWKDSVDEITAVRFDESFVNYTSLTSTAYWFSGLANITKIDGLEYLKTDSVTDMHNMFENCSGIKSLDLSHFNTENVVNMDSMFYYCTDLHAIYVSDTWTTASLTTGKDMFNYNFNLRGGQGTGYEYYSDDYTYAHIDGGTGNPGYLTDINSPLVYAMLSENNTKLTFYYDEMGGKENPIPVWDFYEESDLGWEAALNTITTVEIDPSMENCTTLTSTGCWFLGLSNLTTLTGLEYLQTSNVTNMREMFSACSSLTDLDLSSFKTARVTDMGYMFSGCSGLMTLDLSSFKTSKVGSMDNMFEGCSNLKTIYVGEQWSTDSVSSSWDMFTDCNNIVGGNGTQYNPDSTDVTFARIDGLNGLHGYLTAKNLAPEPYAVLDGNTLTFYYDNQKEANNGMDVGPFSNGGETGWTPYRNEIETVVFDTSFADYTSLTSTAFWFYDCEELRTITGIANLKTDSVTDMQTMFSNTKLESIDLSGFNTANVVNMAEMFAGNKLLTTLDLSSFITAKVEDMHEMFSECAGLTSIDVSSFNTSKVTDMRYMFNGCDSLKSLDLTNFNTEKVTNIEYMFAYCPNLTTIYVGSEWSTESIELGANVFVDNTVLVGGAGTVYNEEQRDYTYAHIDGGTANPGYLTNWEELETRRHELQERLALIPEQHTNINSDLQTLKGTLAENPDFASLSNRCDSLINELAKDSVEVAKIDTALQVAMTGAELNACDTIITQLEGRLAEYQISIAALQDSISAYQEAFDIRKHELQDRLAHIPEQQTNISSDLQTLKGTLAANPDFASLSNRCDSLINELTNDLAEVAKVDSTLQMSLTVADLNACDTIITQLEGHLAEYQVSIAALQDSIAAYQEAFDIRKQELLQRLSQVWVQNSTLNGNLHTLRDSMATNPDFASLSNRCDSLLNEVLKDSVEVNNLQFAFQEYKTGAELNVCDSVITQLEGNLAEYQISIAALQDSISAYQEAFDIRKHELQDRLAQIPEQHTNISSDLQTLKGTLAANPDLASLSNRCDSLINELTNDLAEVAKVDSALQMSLTVADLNACDTIITQLEGNLAEYQISIAALQDSIAAYQDAFAIRRHELQERLSPLEYRLQELQTNYPDLIDQFESLKTSVNSCYSAIQTVNDSLAVAQKTADLDECEAQIVQLEERITKLEETIGSYGDLATLKQSLQTNLSNLQDRLSIDSSQIIPYPDLSYLNDTIALYTSMIQAVSNTVNAAQTGTELDSCGLKINQLEEDVTQLEGIISTYQTEFEATKNEQQLQIMQIKQDLLVIEDDLQKRDPNKEKQNLWNMLQSITDQTAYVQQAIDSANTRQDLDDCSLQINQLFLSVSELKAQIESIIEPYAVLSDNNSKLTFYYDNNLVNRGGILRENITDVQQITTVAFDESFANYYPESTQSWFYGYTSLSSFEHMEFLKTDSVVDMHNMFAECSSLTSLDISQFNTAKVADMSQMFWYCSELTMIVVGHKWTTAIVKDGQNMFMGCTKLVGGEGTAYNENDSGLAYAHIDKGEANPGYLSDVNAVPELSWNEKTLVGKETITIVSTVLSDYDAKTVTLNMDDILALFPEGTTIDDLKFVALDKDNNPTDSYSTDTTGFWMDMESHPASWSQFNNTAQGYYCDYTPDGTLTIGHIPNQFRLEEVVTTTGSLFLVYGNYKYELVMNYSVDGTGQQYFDGQELAFGINGLQWNYKIISASERTCQIGSGTYIWTAIPNSTQGDIEIPSVINGFKVIAIGNYAFYQCSGLTGSLVIPEGVVSIGGQAFTSCTGYTGELVLPSTLKTIGEGAFGDCYNLTGELHIPNGVETINGSAFSNCSSLTGPLTFPENLQTLGAYAFSGCSGLTGSLVIPDFMTEIGAGTFQRCSGMTGTLTIHDGVTSIGERAFNECGFTGELNIPNSVTSIDGMAFNGCTGFTGPLILPENLSFIGSSIFEGCTGFTGELVIPESLTSLNSYGYEFNGCSGLTSLVLHAGITEGKGAFTFSGCKGLKTVTAYMMNPFQTHSDFFDFETYKSATLYVPAGTVDLYKNTNAWSQFQNIREIGGKMLAVGKDSVFVDMPLYDVDAAPGDPYDYIVVNPDLATIADALGCDIADIQLQVLDNNENYIASTANNGGYWFDKDGVVTEWTSTIGTAAFFVEPENAGDYSSLRVGQYPKALHEGDELSAKVYFVHDYKYYIYTVNLKITVPVVDEPMPYGVLANNMTKLTLYYDKDIATHTEGMALTWDELHSSYEMQNARSVVTTIDIDTSFVHYTTLPTTEYLFAGWENLQSINGLENLVTDNMTSMREMFASCPKLVELDLSTFNTSQVTEMFGMFMGCTSLTTIYVDENRWNLKSLTDEGHEMFAGCESLVGELGTTYSEPNFNADYAHIDGGTANPGYLTSIQGPMIAEFEVDGIFYRVHNQDKHQVTVAHVMYADERLYVPSVVEYARMEWHVTALGEMAFADLHEVKCIEIPESIDSVSVDLFNHCPHLAAILWETNVPLTTAAMGQFHNPNLLLFMTDTKGAPSGVTNIVDMNTRTAERVVLSDSEDGGNDFYCPEPVKVKEISYTHSYDQATRIDVCQGWESLVLPFDVQTVTHETKGSIYPIASLLDEQIEDGDKPFWLYEFTWQDEFREAEHIRANTPYIISMPNDPEYWDSYILKGRVTFSAKDTEIYPTEHEIFVEAQNRLFVGCYANDDYMNPDAYLLNVDDAYDGHLPGSVFSAERDNRKARPFEAYFIVTGHHPVKRYMDVFGSGTSAIREIPASRRTADGIYDLTGRKLESESDMRKGVYIIDGKKVMVK